MVTIIFLPLVRGSHDTCQQMFLWAWTSCFVWTIGFLQFIFWNCTEAGDIIELAHRPELGTCGSAGLQLFIFVLLGLEVGILYDCFGLEEGQLSDF